jgi:hypothetical protein
MDGMVSARSNQTREREAPTKLTEPFERTVLRMSAGRSLALLPDK